MADPIIGNYFGIYYQGKRVALAQSKNVALKTAVENITTSDSYGNEEILPTDHNLSASVDGLICASLDNKLQFPEDLSQAAWSKDAGIVVTPFYSDDNFGQLHGNRVVWNAGSNITQEFALTEENGWFSLWLKGSGSVNLIFMDAADTPSELAVTLTANWVRYALPATAIDFSSDCIVVIQKLTGTEVQVANVMFNEGTILLDYKGSQLMAKELMNAQIAKTKLQVRYSNDLDGDIQIAGFCYLSNFELKTKNATANGFTASLSGTNIHTVTTL